MTSQLGSKVWVKMIQYWHAYGLVVSCPISTLATGVQIPAGDFMSRHMPPASPQEVGACCIVCPFVFQWHWGRCTCLENGNVVNVDVNPFPSPHFPFPSIAQCWWGCSPLRGHGVQLGMQTEGHEHDTVPGFTGGSAVQITRLTMNRSLISKPRRYKWMFLYSVCSWFTIHIWLLWLSKAPL
jgi:hypothetical protein